MTVPGRVLLAGFALLLVVTYLLVRGATPDAALHERTLDALRTMVLDDAALQRDVLRARAGLLRDYDPLVRSTDGLRQAGATLRSAAGVAGGEAGRDLRRQVEALRAAVGGQEALVEAFKSRNALLQNSLTYFSYASRQLGRSAGDDGGAVAREIGVLANAMLRFTSDPREEVAAEVAASIGRLDRPSLPRPRREAIRTLVAHGRLIMATLPVVDDLVGRLLAAPVSERARAVQEAYLAQHGGAVARAAAFRVLLYVASVMLVAYLGHLFLRLRANARRLRARLGFEGLIAGISAQFINLPRDRIDEAIERGLARLAGHAVVDRAAILLHDGDGTGVGTSYLWCREGVVAPAGPVEDLRAPGLRWGLEGYDRLGCIHVAHVRALPDGPEKRILEGRGIRSWLCVPMWSTGRRVGLLSFDAVAGERRWTDDEIALLRTAGEIFANALERGRTEAAREALETRLRQAERMEAVGTLAGGIAHDFNNILGAVLGYAEMALAALPGNSRARRHVRQVMKAGRRAEGVVQQILAFSRRDDRERRPVLVQPLVEEAVDLVRVSLPATIEIRTSLDARDAEVVGDPAQLQQVAVNLCTNAAQAMDGRGILEVGLAAVDLAEGRALSHGSLAAGRYLRLTVTDTGHGIDAAVMDRIFEPFFTTRAAARGTGLGLATVHGIVTRHGGALNVRSTPGRGSTFEAYFARAPEAASVPDRTAEPGPSAASLPHGRGETVLLVDDEKPLVLLGEEMLAALGYEPVGFDHGPAALAAFRADPQRFDVVLTDEVMPEMTGTELAASLRRIRPDLPVILMTGYAGPIRGRRLRAAGIREVLRKPLLSRDMAESLARHLHRVA